MTKIISFANHKGGVGKTTTCINLSAYLAKFGYKVLIIDFDPQGNATTSLGINKFDSNIHTIYDAMSLKYSIDNCIIRTCIPNLDLIPSVIDLAGAEIELVEQENREYVLNNLLKTEPKLDEYNFIMIDCPPSLTLLTLNSLTSSNSVLIPIQCEFFALEGLSQLMNTIRLVKEILNSNLQIEGVLLTMKDDRANLVNQVATEIKKFFGKKVYETSIPRNIKLAEAPVYSKPICEYNPNSKGAIAYEKLAQEFLKKQR